MKIWTNVLLVTLVLASTSFARPPEEQSVGAPWPMPQVITTTDTTFALAGPDDFSLFQDTAVTCPVLDQALFRYGRIIFYGRPDAFPLGSAEAASLHQEETRNGHQELTLNRLAVNITDCSEEYPSISSSEEYTLTVTSPNSTLVAHSVWGALRGLETFSQIVYKSSSSQLKVNQTTITDYPRFRHRGFLIDTSRHFLPMELIKKFLDAMAYNKFNVLHWHIVDDPSFPYESTTYPFMSQQGSYKRSYVYSQQNVSTIIDYARDRGIRVLPEFDTPGHTLSWGSVNDLLTPCKDESGNPTGTYGPINPILKSTYEFLKSFFREVLQLFPDYYIHIGGDEVDFSCWESNVAVQAYMAKMGYGQNYTRLQSKYMNKLIGIIRKLARKPLVWQDVVDNGGKVNSHTVVQVWKEPWEDEIANVTRLGHRVILSTPWYLNRAGDPHERDWRIIYKIDPLKFSGTSAQRALVLGGEACMWGEYVDSTNLIQRSWPQGSAVGERLWSDHSVRNVQEASKRLAEHRCRMLRSENIHYRQRFGDELNNNFKIEKYDVHICKGSFE